MLAPAAQPARSAYGLRESIQMLLPGALEPTGFWLRSSPAAHRRR
jgi:hypothetical protein